MRLISREITWYLPNTGRPVTAVIIRAFEDQVTATIHEDVPFLGDKNTETDHRTWDEAVAHAEKVVGQPLRDEYANTQETWSDGDVVHVTVWYDGTATAQWHRVDVASTSANPAVRITRHRLATREQAIQVGQALIPVVRAALKAAVPDRY